MFKLLRIYGIAAIAMLCSINAMADSETFRVKFMGNPLQTVQPSTIQFGTKSVKILYGIDNTWANNTRTINNENVYTINCNNDATPNNGEIPTKGCFYSFTPTTDGVIAIRMVAKIQDTNKGIYIIDEQGNSIDATCLISSTGEALTYNNGRYELPTMMDYSIITCRFNVKAQTTYYIYGGGTKLDFNGYDFYKVGAADADFAFDGTPLTNLQVLGEGTNISMTLGECTNGWETNGRKFDNETEATVCTPKDNPTVGADNIPTAGGYYKFTAKANGILTLKIASKNASEKSFKIVGADGTVIKSMTLPTTTEYTLTTYKVEVESGKEYYVYGKGTKLGLVGYGFAALDGEPENLTVKEGNKPGHFYQTLTRAEEKAAQEGNKPEKLNATPALYISLGNGKWGDKPEEILLHKGEGYVLQSHFEYDIKPDKKSIPTDDGTTPLVFDAQGNKSLPVTGAVYNITATKDGTVYLYFDADDKIKFGMLWITDSKGNPVERYPNGIYDLKDNNGGIQIFNTTQSFMFHATAGTTYYVFNSAKDWDGTTYNDPSRLHLAGVIYSDGETVTQEHFYNLMRGNVHEVGDQIKVPGMVMTFGGKDKTNNIYIAAKQDDIFEAYPEDNKAELRYGYATSGNINPLNELRDIYNAKSKFTPNINTHELPYYGTFYKFEPQRSGKLTVHVLQNGALNLDAQGKPGVEPGKPLTIKTLYIADEKGNTLSGDQVEAQNTGKLKVAHTDYISSENYNVYKNEWEKATVGGTFDISQYNGGFTLINKAYCKYTFDVHPGKTYFIFTNGSKLGFCGYKFIPDESVTPTELTLVDTQTTVPEFTETSDVKVKYDRNFKADTWMPVVLPYSMTETQVKNTFGDETMVIYFDKIEGNTIYFKKHEYQMIVAGRPCFVKPSKDGSVFAPQPDADEATDTNKKGSMAYVTIDGTEIEPGKNGGTGGTLTYNGTFGFTLKASYNMQEKALKPNDYYFGGDGKIYRTQSGENWDIKGFRSFFKCDDNNPEHVALIKGMDMGDNGETTAIDHIETGTPAVIPTNAEIYDLNGRKVMTGTEGLTKLVKGVYIVNGKKVIIK